LFVTHAQKSSKERGNEMANKYGFRELATNKINNLEKVNEAMKKEIKELKENNETLSRCGIQQSAYWKEIKENEVAIKQVEINNLKEEIEELKKENEALHKGWKLPEIEKIRNKRN